VAVSVVACGLNEEAGLQHAPDAVIDLLAQRARAEQLRGQSEARRAHQAHLTPELGIAVRVRGAVEPAVEIVCGDGRAEAAAGPVLQHRLIAGELSAAGRDAQLGARREPVVLAGVESHAQHAGPPLDLHPLEKPQREERRIHRDAVGAERQVGNAVEPVLDGGRAARLVGRHLRPADPSRAPHEHAGHAGEEIGDGLGAVPLDRIGGEHDARERRARSFVAGAWQHRHLGLAQPFAREIAGGGIVGREDAGGVAPRRAE
jgi:hypothetical protein